MKPLVQRILESGLVDKHTALLMEKWGVLDRGAAELVGKNDLKKASEEVLQQFVNDIEEMIDTERNSIHETRLSIEVGVPFLIQPLCWSVGKLVVMQDEMGNFIFSKDLKDINLMSNWFEVGRRFRQFATEQVWEIEEITTLYLGHLPYAHQVRAKDIT